MIYSTTVPTPSCYNMRTNAKEICTAMHDRLVASQRHTAVTFYRTQTERSPTRIKKPRLQIKMKHSTQNPPNEYNVHSTTGYLPIIVRNYGPNYAKQKYVDELTQREAMQTRTSQFTHYYIHKLCLPHHWKELAN